MIGIDSNVILRWVLREVPSQTKLADDLFSGLSRERPGFVSIVTLVEVHSVLLRQLRLPKEIVLDTLERLVRSEQVALDDEETVWDALLLARKGADFPDALVSLTGRLFGCEETVTFDRRAARDAGMRLLSRAG